MVVWCRCCECWLELVYGVLLRFFRGIRVWLWCVVSSRYCRYSFGGVRVRVGVLLLLLLISIVFVLLIIRLLWVLMLFIMVVGLLLISMLVMMLVLRVVL